MRHSFRLLRTAALVGLGWSSACTGRLEDGNGSEGNSGTSAQALCEQTVALPGESQRLNALELQRALTAVLGFNVDLSATPFPSPLSGTGYSTYPEANRVVAADIADIADAADQAGLQAMEHLDALLPCDAGAIDESCVASFLDTFGPRALRGAYDAEDQARLLSLYGELVGGAEALEPPLALAGVISAVVQSPGFLYLVEAGALTEEPGIRRLTDLEVANRLAFMLWDAPPDALLLAVAEAGELNTPEQRRAQAERMLDDPRARVAIGLFVREWLGAGSKDLSQRVTPEVAAAFDEELQRLVEQSFFEEGPGSLQSLATGGTTFVNRSLAEHYGISEVPADDETWVSVSRPVGARAGLLSTGAIAAAHASDAETSVILRGHFVREDLLCDTLGTPPNGALEQNPVLPEGATVRERIEARGAVEGCSSCHVQMDLIGIGMEDIDNVGLFRTEYASGATMDVDGLIVGHGEGAGTSFSGTEALGTALAQEDAFVMCVMRQWYRFGLGRAFGDECHAESSYEAFAESGFDLREAVLALIESERFVVRSDGDAK